MAKKLEFLYRHTTCARFQVTGRTDEAPFDFKNNLLRIVEASDEATDRRNERFLDIVGQMHPRDRNQIKQINPEAAANLERSLGPRVSRDALDTSMIRSGVKGPDGTQQMTQAQIDELAEQQRQADEESALRDKVAMEEAQRLVEENAEKERLARVQAAEAADEAAKGKLNQAATTEEVSGDTGATGPAKPGLQSIKK